MDGSKSPKVDLPQAISESSRDSTRTFTKHSKLECPQFNGNGFLEWHSRIEQFFVADSTPENQKIRFVMMHLEGRALQFHLHYMRIQCTTFVSWLQYVLAMCTRFGSI
ncbi:hypothetical protein COLO4_36404 [Corchorus olitorius]|uniref:Uncharacterized protein n=1 Tax=Corchorus olitorius TaxID=93759 RepID=A0A1R3G908_9ROSI|nr:hypothetical protein COLO4_36404 [Corchorus olitorius]